jgi:predicted thioesterase
MGVLKNVSIGMMAEKIVTVTSEMTIAHFVAHMPRVYATPMMILHWKWHRALLSLRTCRRVLSVSAWM